MADTPAKSLPVIGWREWLILPDFHGARVKAKVDTGARSSSIHAFDIKPFERDGGDYISFSLHPDQRDDDKVIICEAELLEYREVRSSGGHQTRRPVVITHVELMGKRWPIELTLANRDVMGFRMLLGREGMRGRFLVDPAASYQGKKWQESQQK